jgi:hypothetical protein
MFWQFLLLVLWHVWLWMGGAFMLFGSAVDTLPLA